MPVHIASINIILAILATTLLVHGSEPLTSQEAWQSSHIGPNAWCFQANWPAEHRAACCAHFRKSSPRPAAPEGCFESDVLTESFCCGAPSLRGAVLDDDMPDLYRAVWSRRPVPIITTQGPKGWQHETVVTQAMAWGDAEVRPLLARFDDSFEKRRLFCKMRWLGMQALQSPSELLRLMNIVHQVRPTAIVETGTYRGGMTLFLAQALDVTGVRQGKVFTIDRNAFNQSLHDDTICPVCADCLNPRHARAWRRVAEYQGRSNDQADPATQRLFQAVQNHQLLVPASLRRSIVILDASHDLWSVVAEIQLLQGLVSIGGYLVIQDAQLDRVYARPGPRAAAMLTLLQSSLGFVWDRSDELDVPMPLMHHIYLKRVFTASIFESASDGSLNLSALPADLVGLPWERVLEAQAWVSHRSRECKDGTPHFYGACR